MKELCPKCKINGFCQFKKEAQEIAQMANSGEILKIHASETIAELRHFARDKWLCPNINKVNPKIKDL
ncbi:MAG: hypothetical protein CO135_00940 [Candidatus Levybacteria bacterium CG_4_9_14_3_um_filter_35_16]|nr:MAG: hypothetical protein COY68_03295 [Candidatus Levybacteria bacterium CG_4_10_14_0_8_um_filter_35_23]PIZ97340.1 MAG: hypothetical protein COX78_04645 [Candidatus Levybacteria bacterium CG_4_10_14_0_2_um_filter_35_8]PJA91520.1 MAG: hypothetical protein CO135_00940 [Candidatus Levybacteria bacterium CG_4_9_14_3_um_filter_35_16]PJC54088.1 MAG: hypothetical protein CO028_04305 [Candidatus Levybacteria bacterium CG_4_9_14_0_2_um_filter_35_21]